MTKGTPAMGKKGKRTSYVQRCRRCGTRSYHIRNKKCAHCGYGASAKLRRYAWQAKWRGKTKKKKRPWPNR